MHFDEVGPTLVVEFSFAAVVEERNLQLSLQVTLQLTHLQRPDAVGAVHRQVLLVVCAVGRLARRRRTHTHTPQGMQYL